MPSRSVVFICLLFVGCSTWTGRSFVPGLPGYSETQKKVYVLKKRLLEVSGIAYLDKDSMAAVNDEKGELFIVNLETNESLKYKFGGKDDYEDLVKVDTTYYVLISNGNIVEVGTPPGVHEIKYEFPGNDKKTEFESLVYYKKLNKLVLISKDQRERVAGITAYSFDLKTKQFDPEPFFNLPLKDVLVKLTSYSAECKPSGAALHPITGKLYMVASVGKLLLICSPDGKLEKLFKLNPTQFPQPEGITFADNGDMFISNEGLDGKATILKFPYANRK